MIDAPIASSPFNFNFSKLFTARKRATPPPGTIPSATAARVACKASSTRAFFSFSSVSVAAPTLTTATPPTSLAKRSSNFSRSYLEVEGLLSSRLDLSDAGFHFLRTAGAINDCRFFFGNFDRLCTAQNFEARPRPASSPLLRKRLFRLSKSQYLRSIALRRSPKPGALTAHMAMPALILLTTRVANASPSISSAIIKSGRFPLRHRFFQNGHDVFCRR